VVSIFEQRQRAIAELEAAWSENDRWTGVRRDYSAADVIRLRGSMAIDHTLATAGAARLWELLQSEDYVHALGAMSGGQAVQMVRAGLQAIYVSGWQVAADANLSENVYPDQSLYPVSSVPSLVRRINNALLRADQIEWAESTTSHEWMAPIVADAEAGFGGPLNAYELMKGGHMGGKVLVPTAQHIRTLKAARLAADVAGVPTLVVARTDALGATLLTSDIDPADGEFLNGERTPEGFFGVRAGIEAPIARAIAYAPYSDVLWCETSTPDLDEARRFAEAVLDAHPGKLLAYNCSPSFNWRRHLDEATIARFQKELGAMGYRFQFITLAGFHALNVSMFELARGYAADDMSAYLGVQDREFALESEGYTATRHQREVGAGYFDEIAKVVSGGEASTLALLGSTEEEQFEDQQAATG